MSMGTAENVVEQAFEAPSKSTTSKSTSKSSSVSNITANNNFPPPKTDKPRPHICTTCMRSFARLEHLKRHERSHTKEKPFECPECTRCFARRDLLLRHQQKLHSSTTPSSRPRSGRRESAAGVASGRVRKNSMANGAQSGMRPRANTLSHVDTSTLGMLANSTTNFGRNFVPGHGHHNSLNGLSGSLGYHYRGLGSSNHASMSGLAKIDTSYGSSDLANGLRTAPPYGGFGADSGMSSLSFGQGNIHTINPHALHMNGLLGLGIDQSSSPFQQIFPGVSQPQSMMDDDGSFDWMAQGFEHQMTFAQGNETAIDDSSPSAMSTNSPAGTNEMNAEMTASNMHYPSVTAANIWQQTLASQGPMVGSPLSMDFTSNFNDMAPPPPIDMLSPKSLLGHGGPIFDMNLPTPPDMASIDPTNVSSGMNYNNFPLPLSRDGGASTASTASADSSLLHSSVTTTTSSDLVSDHMRYVLITGLSQNAGFGQRKYSQPMISSPLSPGSASRLKSFNATTFPSTQDLQRYVIAYVKYSHPHLPFLHIPTLNFDSPEYATPIRGVSGHSQFGQTNVANGGSCLLLSMAAIGAMYEQDVNQSKDLFECAKRLISGYLEERRKANMTKTQFAPRHHTEYEDTPLWLVQAMLLNVIYGHNCGDKTAADIASNHCAALVSLTRGAELARPYQGSAAAQLNNYGMTSPNGQFSGDSGLGWNSMINEHDDIDWHEWKVIEERKRTLYAVFILSSMLVTAYNHPPALTNSEIRLDLPCDEELWAAESTNVWQALGGAKQAQSRSISFATALTHLLMSANRQKRRRSSTEQQQNGHVQESELKPSTFGCFILVNALHNYIWETRQRHLGRQWTAGEIEKMHAHIEPALRAWQAAWASNPSHSLERPNPFGAGPLSADSIPLLDLAYVRLFINLGRSKEAFWQRDYDAMAEELAKGPEVMHNQENEADYGEPSTRKSPSVADGSETQGTDTINNNGQVTPADSQLDMDANKPQSTRRELHLRKAASYAADSLSVSDKLGLSFAEPLSRELPMQSALCAFDCAQVLAEWITTVQERVGKYLGVVGRDSIDLLQVPGIILLEDGDRKLLGKVDELLLSAEQKIGNEINLEAGRAGGYGSRILMLTAYFLERSAIWPVTKLMARSLQTQAEHMKERALASIATT